RFMGMGNSRDPIPTNLVWQTPFNPVRKMVQTTYWQVNDPLVHYTTADLTDPLQTNTVEMVMPPTSPPTEIDLRTISKRYRPWGREKGGVGSGPLEDGSTTESEYAYDFRV